MPGQAGNKLSGGPRFGVVIQSTGETPVPPFLSHEFYLFDEALVLDPLSVVPRILFSSALLSYLPWGAAGRVSQKSEDYRKRATIVCSNDDEHHSAPRQIPPLVKRGAGGIRFKWLKIPLNPSL
jgi:hypothetical protein